MINYAVPSCELVRMRREQLGMTQGQLAFKLGYRSSSFITMIETGRCKIPVSRVRDFARVLDISVFELLVILIREMDSGLEDVIRGPGGFARPVQG